MFGFHNARAAAAKAGTVILAEGYTDVIALHQAGLANTVGLMGTALTPEQVSELARMAKVVQLALDADGAGQEAMLRAARVARGKDLDLRIVPLPPGSDPADLVLAEGPQRIQELAAASVPFVSFQVDRALAAGDADTAEGKDRIIEALRPVFAPATLPPGALREELLKRVADRLNLAQSLVSSWLSAPASSRATAAEPRQRQRPWRRGDRAGAPRRAVTRREPAADVPRAVHRRPARGRPGAAARSTSTATSRPTSCAPRHATCAITPARRSTGCRRSSPR